ncbi:MAG: hypothetical protein KDC44_12495, partial [Phaeodactylibacter sp.]|nr:hypothetical protein [Phaeodactylibacter sp.]
MIIFKLGKWSLVATLCMLAQLVAAQDYPLFLVDSIGLFGVPVAGSAHWLGADCSTEAYTLASPYVEDVSIAPNGFVYGIGYSINSGVDALYEVETTGAPNYWGSLGIVQFTNVAQVYKGLACDSLRQLYLAGDRLARYHNGNLQELGNF